MAGWSAANVGAGQDMAGSSVHGCPHPKVSLLHSLLLWLWKEFLSYSCGSPAGAEAVETEVIE